MAPAKAAWAWCLAAAVLSVALAWPGLPLVYSVAALVLLLAAVPRLVALRDFPLPTPDTGRFRRDLSPGELETWLRNAEAAVEPMKPTVQKTVVWADAAQKAATEYVIVSIHGWSASSRELRRFDTMLAAHLGANLYRHRLTGHGLLPLVRGAQSMDRMSPEDLFRDAVDAFNSGRILGGNIIFLASSTGAALATWVCGQSWSKGFVAGVVFNSPAYTLVPATTFPLVKRIFRYCPRWLSVFIAEQLIRRPFLPKGTIGFIPFNEDNKYYWTHRYPVSALRNLFGTLWHVEYRSSPSGLPGCIDVPMLVFGNWEDHVVDLRSTLKIMEEMGYRHQEIVPAKKKPKPGTAVPMVKIDDPPRSPEGTPPAATVASKSAHGPRMRSGVGVAQRQLLYTFEDTNNAHIIVSDVFNPHILDEAFDVVRQFWREHLP